jgi:hypothetical protein
MLLVAEFDPPDFHRQASLVLADYTDAHDHLPLIAIGIGHNHFSSPAHYGSVDDGLASQVAAFLASITA